MQPALVGMFTCLHQRHTHSFVPANIYCVLMTCPAFQETYRETEAGKPESPNMQSFLVGEKKQTKIQDNVRKSDGDGGKEQWGETILQSGQGWLCIH